MSLYKYVPISTLKYVLNGTIRFTQPSAFNDPFEMLPEFYCPPDFGIQNIQFSLTDKRRENSLGDLDINFKSEYCNDTKSREFLEQFNKCLGILCLSKTKDSLLMWSHYAEQYMGAVIEFDDSHEFFNYPIEIEYRSNRPKKDLTTYLSGNIPIAELCNKPIEWSYEQEVRIIRNLLDCKKNGDFNNFPVYVKDIPLSCIKSIILGERNHLNKQSEIDNIWNLIKDTNIKLFVSVVDHWDYKMRLEQVKADVPVSKQNPFISPRTAYIFKNSNDLLGIKARTLIEKHPLSKIVNASI